MGVREEGKTRNLWQSPSLTFAFISFHVLAQLNAFKASCLSLLFITTRLEPSHVSSPASRADNGKGK